MATPLHCEIRPPRYDYLVYDGSEEVYEWVRSAIGEPDPEYPRPYSWVQKNDDGSLTIATFYGQMACNVGDYIVRDGPGGFRPYSPNDFEASFSPLVS